MEKYFMGVDLGGTKILAVISGKNGKIVASESIPTEAGNGPQKVIGNILHLIDLLLGKLHVSRHHLQAIGIGSPGQIQREKGLVIDPPNLRGWRTVPLRKLLQKQFGRKIPIYLENDANCAALGEHAYGAGKGSRHMLYLTISTGIGGGFILDGNLYRGARGAAGEVGHTNVLPNGPVCGCGKKGCLEAVSSGTAIGKKARALVQTKAGKKSLILKQAGGVVSKVTAETVEQAAKLKDPVALSIYNEAGYYLGVGVSNLINLFNPERVVVGGGVTKAGSLLFSPLQKVVKEMALRIPLETVSIVPARLGNLSGAYGALSLCHQELK